MRQSIDNEWVNKHYIMNEYPISQKTYCNKLNLLDSEPYSGYTFHGENKERFIHMSILDTIFLSDRIPNYNQPHQIRKWVKKHSWDYFGNITPMESDIRTNEELTRRLFRKLKSTYKNLILFYSIEQNPNYNKHYHTHFLIKGRRDVVKDEIVSQIKQDKLLNEFLYPNEIKTNHRFELEPYDFDLYQERGVNYVLKFDNKIGLLK